MKCRQEAWTHCDHVSSPVAVAPRATDALLMLLILSAAAFAQGVTGTVSGTVKDAQGGVVPGATVTLINEAQGTQMAPVVTNATGDFVVPNVAAATYTVQIEMASFRTLKLSGIAVSPGARIVLPAMTIEVGGATEQLVVTAEAPLVQMASGEKSFTVATESVSSLPLANRSYDALLGLTPGVNSTPGNLTPASAASAAAATATSCSTARPRDGPGRQPSRDARQRRGHFRGPRGDLELPGRAYGRLRAACR